MTQKYKINTKFFRNSNFVGISIALSIDSPIFVLDGMKCANSVDFVKRCSSVSLLIKFWVSTIKMTNDENQHQVVLKMTTMKIFEHYKAQMIAYDYSNSS